jgi:hypothetical protein
MAITRPINLTKPFADAAGVGYVRTIPEASQIGITPGAASLEDGFPPLNFLDPTAGGVPPSGQDMNGILKILSQHTAFQGSGGCYRFDSALSTAMGGYPVGAVLQDDTGVTAYVNSLAGNTTNFNTTPASIGVSWHPYAGTFQATETIAGKAELATTAEATAGTDDLRIMTPLKVRSSINDRGFRFNGGLIAITANTSLTAAQTNRVCEIQTDAITLTLPEAATVTNGDTVTAKLSGTVGTTYTLKGFGAELIHSGVGAANTYIGYPGETITVMKHSSGVWYVVMNGFGALTFAELNTTNGYKKFPGKCIYQYGIANGVSGGTVVTFPIAFPNNCRSVVLGNAFAVGATFAMSGVSTTGFVLTSSVAGPAGCHWQAIGF